MICRAYLIALLLLAGCTSPDYGAGSDMPACLFHCTTVDDNTSVSAPRVRDYNKRTDLDLSNSRRTERPALW
jgi:hypothetical protein